MKEYEVMIEIFNACAGSSRPDTKIEEVELNNPDEYVKSKHGADYAKVRKEVLEGGEVCYTLEGDSMTYKYMFTEF